MKALILSAGVSRRLYPLTYNQPKCLLEVGPKRILDYQLSALLELGITEVTMVLGYYRERIMEYISENYPKIILTPVINHHYFETNTAYSVNMAISHVFDAPFLLMNADVVYPKALLQQIISSKFQSALAVEIKKCGREEVKVIEGKDQRIVAIGKDIIQENSLGEFIGVAKFSSKFGQSFSHSLKALVEAGGNADYFEAAIHPLLDFSDIYYEDITHFPCIEIDFKEDLDNARDIISTKWYQ